MAVITISRQVAALGDEIASALAKKLGYVFIDRKEIEKRIVSLGFSEEKLKKYFLILFTMIMIFLYISLH